METRLRRGLLSLIAAGAVALPVAAEDFTFRRIGVAPADGGRRITVQIDPEEQARRIAPPGAPTASPAAMPGPAAGGPASDAARFGWFWTLVPAEAPAMAGRFQLAIGALASPPPGADPVPAPRLTHLQQIAALHGAELLRATAGTAVSPALALAVIAVESAGRSDALSRAGAQGLMQLIPATATRFGVSDAFDPAQNIRGGVAYLDWLMAEFDRDPVLVLAGYNAGEGAVRRAGGVPPYPETRDYVPRVLAAWQVARGLCRVPPELPADPCIFVLADPRQAALPAGDG